MAREVAVDISASGIVPKGSNKHRYKVDCNFPVYQVQVPQRVLVPREFHSSIMIWKRV